MVRAMKKQRNMLAADKNPTDVCFVPLFMDTSKGSRAVTPSEYHPPPLMQTFGSKALFVVITPRAAEQRDGA